MMMKLKLTTEIAMKLDDKTINLDGVQYHISTSTFKRNGKPVLAEMTVDAFENDEWVHELSGAYHENEIINSEYDVWLLGLL